MPSNVPIFETMLEEVIVKFDTIQIDTYGYNYPNHTRTFTINQIKTEDDTENKIENELGEGKSLYNAVLEAWLQIEK